MYYKIYFIHGKPYKYLMKSVWDKKKKQPVAKVVKYCGKATKKDIEKYYKGQKFYFLRKIYGRGII